MKLSLLLFFLFTCNLNAQNSSDSNKKLIIGEWIILKSKFPTSENVELRELGFKVCPKAKFTIDQKVVVNFGNNDDNPEIYRWEIKKDKIFFYDEFGKEIRLSKTFCGKYKLEFIQKQDVLELELTDSTNSHTYVLKK